MVQHIDGTRRAERGSSADPTLVANLLPNKVMCVCFNIEYILIPEDFQNYAIDVL